MQRPERTRPLSLGDQKRRLIDEYPQSRLVHTSERLVWVGDLTPAEDAATYEVLVDHRLKRVPLIYVTRPELRLVGDQPLPHVYTWNTLCLFFDEQEWNQSAPLSSTIVPWASEWLFFYELWLATAGTWLGAGVHPGSGSLTRSTRRSLQRDKQAKLKRLKSALRLAYGRQADMRALLQNAYLQPQRRAVSEV